MTGTIVAIHSRLPMPDGIEDIDARKWRVLCETIFPSAKTSEAITMALDYCRARGLDPFRKPVHIVPMWNSVLRREVETVWPGINEIQTTAARTRQWAGMDEPRWGEMITQTFKGRHKDDNGKLIAVEVTVTYPEWCAVTVYRMIEGQRCAFTEPAFWLEAYSHSGGAKSELPTSMWIRRPRGQLHKVAKAASLRAAFPEEASDYSAEEMEGKEIDAGGIMIEREPTPQIQIAQPIAPLIAPPHDAKTGEILGPSAIPLLDGPDRYITFGRQFVAAIRTAETQAELDEWQRENAATLASTLMHTPKAHVHIKDALAKEAARLRPVDDLVTEDDASSVLG
jgi:phage recombination protein Bet